MTADTVRILVVEDFEPDYELLSMTLGRQGIAAQCQRVEDRESMAAALHGGHWDAVISDHQLPRFSSFEALATLRASGQMLPFIIVSGTIGEDVAVEAMRAGADDYLIKGRLTRLGAALRRALADAQTRRERLQAQAALRDSEARLRALSAHLQTAVENERKAIAREIHDDIGGMLTALRFDLSRIVRRSGGELVERARQAIDTLDQIMLASQRIMRSLRPPVLDAGIVAALEWQAAQFRKRTGIACRFSSSVERVRIDEEAAVTIYRTAQEALTNVVKHAQATRVSMDLVLRNDLLSLEITDDGCGLTAADLQRITSFGLRGLAERAHAAGGWLDVLPATQGTTVLLTMPAGPCPPEPEPAE